MNGEITWLLLKLAFWVVVIVVIVVSVQNSTRKRKTWTVDVEGRQHTVQVRHGAWSGARAIVVDGNTVEKSQKFLDTGSEHRFDLEGHPCILKIRSSLLSYDYELYLDGRLM